MGNCIMEGELYQKDFISVCHIFDSNGLFDKTIPL